MSGARVETSPFLEDPGGVLFVRAAVRDPGSRETPAVLGRLAGV